MFKNVHQVFFNSAKNKHSGLEWFSTSKTLDDALITQLKSAVQDNHPIVFINAKAHLPPHHLTRLLQPMLEQAAVQHISALSVSQFELSPIIAPFNGTLADLDHAVFLLNEAQYFKTQTHNPNCFAIRDISCLDEPVARFAVNNLVVDVTPKKSPLPAPQFPDTGDQNPLPAHPLAETQNKLLKFKPSKQISYPKLDNKPTALHIAMDWGGGVHQWINDFAAQHDEMNHLVLLSHGEFFRQQHGERFTLLWHQTEGLCISEFHLAQPIKSTVSEHPEYQHLLHSITTQWQVSQLVVSSLIGHAMDCLDTGLPTWRVLHDYFPHWPSLNAQLDAPTITSNDIEQALEGSKNEPFGTISAAQLRHWQRSQAQQLAADHVQIIAPDDSVKNNLLKLPHAEVFRKTKIIPHAIDELKAIPYQAEKTPFTVLVLGRITEPKGQELLFECISSLVENQEIQFVLLGAGKQGKHFTSLPNTTVIENYQHHELTSHLITIAPQLALLTSITSETFSYTLSELLASGLPILATQTGAFATRLTDGENGLLLAPEATTFSTTILNLQQNPAQLKQLHQGSLDTQLISQKNNKAAYSALLHNKQQSNHYVTAGLLTPKPWAQQLQIITKQKHTLVESLQLTEANLAEKTAWAKTLTQQNKHLEHNLDLQRAEVDQLKQSIATQAQQYETQHKQTQEEVVLLQNHLEKLDAQIQTTLTERDQLAEEKQRLEVLWQQTTEQLAAANNQLVELKNSRSWRFTRPMRRFTTYARHKRNAIRYRWSQLCGLPRRVVNSLTTRGLKQTALIAKNKLKKAEKHTPTQAQIISHDYQTITINTSKQPLVSVIIPVYNQFKHTYHCLHSLARLTDKTAMEIWVIDDCSTDETADAIKHIKGINYHRQTENGGFIESCNTGARLAEGQYLLFLNNDTEALDGWLDELIGTFNSKSDAGLVGSQLLYPNGQLQEAGGIVFADASGWNYGRLASPNEPEFQHLREATYISGASIMIRKSLFTELGLFDERYKPAYYEDTDLAFAVRSVGKKVYYQPHSKVIHFEGISSGTDLTSGTKKYQVINQQKFLQKWQLELKNQPKPGTDIELARFQNQPNRVLIFDACTPTPDQDSGSLRMLNLIKIFIELGYQVSFVPENMAHFKKYTEDLQRLGVNCIYAPKYPSPIAYLEAKGSYYQTVILSRYYVAEPLMTMLRSYCPQAKLWFDTVDLHYLRETRMAELDHNSSALKAAQKTKSKELGVASGCDLTLVVSPYEQTVLAKEAPDLKVAVLSNIHEVYGGHVGYTGSQDLLFIGGYQHTPNVDGLLWFVEHIFPTVLAAIPDVILHVVGSKAPPEIIALGEHPHIEYHGFVEDIEPMMQNIRIAVAPLRFGAGVKGKVNMSMSYGQPVVGTKVAVEGMYTQHRHDVMMADKPEDFAASVIELYQDQSLWQTLSKGGVNNVERWFSFNAAKQVITELLNK